MHFVEYGVLAVLLFRAFAHTIPDAGVYLAAWLLGTLLGGVDELIQWAVPERYFDFRDIALNCASCGLALVALSRGLGPVYIRPGLSRASIRRIAALGAIVLLMALLFLRNTPAARARYEQRVPGVARLLTHARAMTQHGYLYEDPVIGEFKSRLSPRELQEADRTRAVEAMRADHNPDIERRSGVSTALITAFTERQVTGILLAVLLAWAVGWAYLYRRKKDVECHPSQRSSANEIHHSRD